MPKLISLLGTAKQLYRDAHAKAYDEYREKIRSTISVGMTGFYLIGFDHKKKTPRYISCEVVEAAKYEWQDTIRIRNIKSGLTRDIDASDFFIEQ